MDTLPGKTVLCSDNDILKYPQSHATCYIEKHITQKLTLVLVLRISASIVRNNTLCGGFIILIRVLEIPSQEKCKLN